MSGIMLDSTNEEVVANAIRQGFTMRNMVVRAAAGYIDGRYKWPGWPAGVAQVDITVTGAVGAKAHTGEAGDVEPGDLDPQQGAEWVKQERGLGTWPVLYVNRTNKGAVLGACGAAGFQVEKDYGLWVATLDGTFTDADGTDLRTQAGVVAVQAFPASMTGIDADASIITALGDSWLRIGNQAHITDGRTSLGELAASRGMSIFSWITLQEGLSLGDATRLTGEAIPPAGLRWWSIS